MSMRGGRQTYWASWDDEDLASKLKELDASFRNGRWSPLYDAWVKNSYHYYSPVLSSTSWVSALNFVGEQGELVDMKVPEARKAIRDRIAVITKQKLAFNAIAKTEGTDVTEEMRIANALAENLVENERLDTKQSLLCEMGSVVGTGFISATWRSDKGSPRIVIPKEVEGKDGSTEQVLYDGDVEVSVHHLTDVVFPFRTPDWQETDWVKIRRRRNRWALVAQHPEFEEAIISLPSAEQESMRLNPAMSWFEDDQVFVYEWYHRPRPGLDQGRVLIFSDPKTIYYSDINKYKTLPVERFLPEPIFGLGYGYPQLSNLLPSQEMLDHEMSCVATNHSALGVQCVTAPKGSDIEVCELFGLNLYKYLPVPGVPGGGKPEPLQLTQSSPETYKFADMLSHKIQQLSGINEAMRGEVSPSSSGVMVATLTANALEFMNSDSKELQLVMEKTVMHAIRAYRAFAKVPRLVRLTGKNYQTFTRPFTGDKLAPIEAIKLTTVNPLMQTAAGRVEIAQEALKTGVIKNFSDYISVIDGEPVSKLLDSDLSQNDLIASENEQMSTGQKVPVLYIDNHALHIFKHKCLLNDPEIRKNENRVNLILSHIEEHDHLAQTTAPWLQAMANTGVMPQGGIPPAQPAQPSMPGGGGMPPPPPGGGGGGGRPGGGGGGPSMQMGASPDGGTASEMAQTMPTSGMPREAAHPAKPARDLLGRES